MSDSYSTAPLKERNLNTIKESTIRNLWPKGKRINIKQILDRKLD